MAALSLSRRAIELVDIRTNDGVHPRLGAVDVVPFVPLLGGEGDERFTRALQARQAFAEAFASLGVPCFYYGPERALPQVRKMAFSELFPDVGPSEPHPSAGACCVGVRDFLVAYNLIIDRPLEETREIAASLRRPEVRALGLALGPESQLSFNLVAPDMVSPEQIYDEVAGLVPVVRAELVGLLPEAVLARIDKSRWRDLDLSSDKTVEAALRARRDS